MVQRVQLSIIIVSWNVRAYLAACLESIAHSLTQAAEPLGLEVLVVDSGSTDGSAELLQALRARYPWLVPLPQPTNVGFSRGNNIGLAAAQGRYLLLLNPDTELRGDALTHLLRYLEQHAPVGIVGPHTLNSDGTTQSTRRRFPTVWTALFESTWLQGLAPRRVLDRYYVGEVADDAVAEVDWVQGSALLARRDVYAQIGGLDERYVMFSEELDWCRRARAAGWRVVYVGSAQIVHHGGKSTEQAGAWRHIHFQRSKLRYFRKYHGLPVALALRLVLVALYGYQLALEAAKALLGHKRALRAARVRDYWQVIRSLLWARPGLSR